MDLGSGVRNAIGCASSRGLGRAWADSLAREGVDVTLNNLLPERIDTDRQRDMVELRAKLGGVRSNRLTAR